MKRLRIEKLFAKQSKETRKTREKWNIPTNIRSQVSHVKQQREKCWIPFFYSSQIRYHRRSLFRAPKMNSNWFDASGLRSISNDQFSKPPQASSELMHFTSFGIRSYFYSKLDFHRTHHFTDRTLQMQMELLSSIPIVFAPHTLSTWLWVVLGDCCVAWTVRSDRNISTHSLPIIFQLHLFLESKYFSRIRHQPSLRFSFFQ